MISQIKPLRYHLRFQILPGPQATRRARELVTFCKDHGIEEVALFIAAEEWNNGLLSRAAEDRWFFTIRKIKRILDRADIGVSLNPWMTVLHTDRGRTFPKDRRFQAMVSPLGETARACASLADPNWRKYICDLYGRFAGEGFRVLWIEDDFRYHNHGPLTWGGGFEDIILRRFSRKIGHPVARPALVRNLLQPGQIHPWRALWLATWREIQLEVAAEIASAVEHNSAGQSKIGLMSSHPAHHSIEGRDWQKLFAAVTIRGQVAHRPHFAGYRETVGSEKTYSILMLDIQRSLRPATCEVAPEIENFPFTHWNKSDPLTWAEMAFCQFFGSDALLLDLFPFSGNSAQAEPRIGELLDRSRPALEWISARFSNQLRTCGVGLPWRSDAAARVQTAVGHSLDELAVSHLEGGQFLLSYGVPVSASKQPVNILAGQSAWIFSDDELLEFLRGGLVLDGVAADILCRRGFRRYLGVNCDGLVGREEANYAIEIVTAAETGVPAGFGFNHNLLPRVAKLQRQPGAREWTALLRADGTRFGSAVVAFKNKLGGQVVTFAAASLAALPPSDQKQTLIHRALRFLCSPQDCPVTVTGGAHLLPMHLQEKGRQVIVVFNGSPDSAAPVLHCRGGAPKNIRATLLRPLTRPTTMPTMTERRRGELIVRCRQKIPYLGFVVLDSKD